MSKYSADVLIHIDEEISPQQVNEMEYDLARMEGVISACVNCQNPHLMLVDYDPMKVKSTALLRSVTSSGFHAEMVGF